MDFKRFSASRNAKNFDKIELINAGFTFAFWVSFCLNIQGYNGSSESTSYRFGPYLLE
jgi:hypothetical protein